MKPSRLVRNAALALLITPLPALADPLADAVGSLDPAIHRIARPGHWQTDGRQGDYRIVVTRDATPPNAARIFIQWIAKTEGGAPAIERSIEIPEFSALKADIADFTAEPEAGGLTVFIDVANPSGDAPASYELIVEDDGSYRFGPASN